jgi:uncharacterized protein (TIGR02453 family)
MPTQYFTKDTMSFLRKLANNNNRDWFNDHKTDYESAVRTPALQFIEDIAGELAIISPHFLALPKKVGGSLMRVHRDTRFGKNKRPYKTNIGIQFRHEAGKDVHAPGFYIHIEPGECFLGVGIWRPDSTALGKIRQHLDEKGEQWIAVIKNKKFSSHYELSGESLSRPPRGYDKTHPLLEDLKRKDFIAITPLEDDKVVSSPFLKTVLNRFNAGDEYMRFLCNALNLRY